MLLLQYTFPACNLTDQPIHRLPHHWCKATGDMELVEPVFSRTSNWKVKKVMQVPLACQPCHGTRLWAFHSCVSRDGQLVLCLHPAPAVLHRPHAMMGRGMPAPTFCLVFPSNYIWARQERAAEAAQVPVGNKVLAGWTWD